jgi:ribonuclease P protein component
MSENGYQKKDRLLKRRDYLLVSKTGKKCHKKHFLCIFKKGNGERSRLGITVTKKVGCSAKRNRIKRVCREFYRLNRRRLEGIWDISIIAKKSAADASRDQSLKSLNELFHAISENQPSDIYY